MDLRGGYLPGPAKGGGMVSLPVLDPGGGDHRQRRQDHHQGDGGVGLFRGIQYHAYPGKPEQPDWPASHHIPYGAGT